MGKAEIRGQGEKFVGKAGKFVGKTEIRGQGGKFVGKAENCLAHEFPRLAHEFH